MAWPSGRVMSAVIDFLLRLAQRKYADVLSRPASSFRNGGPQARVSSPAPGPLDLDDVRAQVGQRLAHPRPGKHPAEIQDPNPVKRPGHLS
jgi:hypothetical protein